MKKVNVLILSALVLTTLLVTSCVMTPSIVVKQEVVNVSQTGSFYHVECEDGSIYQTSCAGIVVGEAYYFTIEQDYTIRRYSLVSPAGE